MAVHDGRSKADEHWPCLSLEVVSTRCLEPACDSTKTLHWKIDAKDKPTQPSNSKIRTQKDLPNSPPLQNIGITELAASPASSALGKSLRRLVT